MPYIDKYQRPLLEELVHSLKQYSSWQSEDEHATLMEMLFSWLEVKAKENSLKIDGYVNFVCTIMLKRTHQTYHLNDKKHIIMPLDKEVCRNIRLIFERMFEKQRSYSNYERLYGLLCLMEVEFERRGWSLGRKEVKTFFNNEKKYWRGRIAEYEDLKIHDNGDV